MCKYLLWKGRINRLQYFHTQLILLIFQIAVVITTLPLIYESKYDPGFVEMMANSQIYVNLLVFVIIYFDLCFKIQRFHDFNKSATSLMWLLVPFVNLYFLTQLFFKPGDPTPNRFGKNTSINKHTDYKESA